MALNLPTETELGNMNRKIGTAQPYLLVLNCPNLCRVGGVFPALFPEQGGEGAPQPKVAAVLGRGGDAAGQQQEHGRGQAQLPGDLAPQWSDQ